jgi:ABC-type multidrug transport system fused ATPase/permease subunit
MAGSILVDGVDIQEVDLTYLRQRITIIPQDPTLFTASLRYNLDPEDKASDEKIKQLL